VAEWYRVFNFGDEDRRFKSYSGHCVVFLGKTLYSNFLSPPRCIMGTWSCSGLRKAKAVREKRMAPPSLRWPREKWDVTHLTHLRPFGHGNTFTVVVEGNIKYHFHIHWVWNMLSMSPQWIQKSSLNRPGCLLYKWFHNRFQNNTIAVVIFTILRWRIQQTKVRND